MLASLFFVFGVLTRPYIAIAGLPLLIFTTNDFVIKRPVNWARNFLGIWLICFLFIGCWTLRNYLLTKEFVPLEKAVHPETLERMKPDFRGFWSFSKCWGEDGFVMNTYHDPLYFSAALKGDTSSVYVENILNTWPSKVVDHFGRKRLSDVLRHYQYSALKTKPYFDSVKAMPEHFLPEQLAVKKEFDELASEYRKSFFFDYWIKTPFRYLKLMVVNSNTGNLYLFQKDHRDKMMINLYRYTLLAIHMLVYVSLVINFFVMKGFANRLAFVYVPLLFIFFFVMVHREIEQRYMLPILPILLAGAACSGNWFLTLISGKKAHA
jgi:hypothetical protein